jgi:CheY-like chemotaxis protein
VLVLSKVDANLIEIHPVEVQPRVLIQNTIKMFAAELAANKAQMTLEMEPSFQELQVDWVTLDPGRLLQILINLCTNAIKFSMDSHIRKISIQVAASATIPNHSSRGVRYLHGVNEEAFEDPTTKPEWGSGEILYLQFQVTDRGQGMTMEEMQILFQRFKQASPKTHTQYGGSGLGLFIARLLSRLQGGEIGVTSTAGKGTTFAFYIKVRRAKTPHGTDVHAVVPQVNLPVGGHGPDSPSVLSAATTRLKDPSEVSILIVEDNVVNQRVLSRQLKTQGFTVAIANNGAESLDFIKKSEHWTGTPNQEASSGPTHPHHPLSVILMDIEMPVMNGTEAASRIREFEKSGALLRHIPIIAITANARMEQIAVAKDAGMDEVVSKPFRIPELLAKIETFVGPLEKSGS